MNEFDQCINELCTSITNQAVRDWIMLKRASDEKRKVPKFFEDNLENLEKFFKSPYGEEITKMKGEFVIQKLNEFYNRTGGDYGRY